MLEALRKSVSGILAKILIGLLIVSFAVWGIGDMVRSYGRDVVAQVGDRSISANEFRQAYQIQVSNFSQQFGRRLTPQEAKVLGIEQQVNYRLCPVRPALAHLLHQFCGQAIDLDPVTERMRADGLGQQQEVAQALRMGSIEGEILYTGNLVPLAPSVGVMERLLETVSFEASDKSGLHLTIDAAYVDGHLAELSRDEDLSRYIL